MYSVNLARIATGDLVHNLVMVEKIKNFKYPDSDVPSIPTGVEDQPKEMEFIAQVNQAIFPPTRLIPILNFIKIQPDIVEALWK